MHFAFGLARTGRVTFLPSEAALHHQTPRVRSCSQLHTTVFRSLLGLLRHPSCDDSSLHPAAWACFSQDYKYSTCRRTPSLSSHAFKARDGRPLFLATLIFRSSARSHFITVAMDPSSNDPRSIGSMSTTPHLNHPPGQDQLPSSRLMQGIDIGTQPPSSQV